MKVSKYPIPVKIFFQNFGSHRNTIITFGELMERCYITGSSGSGKSHILNALQYVLGKKIQRDNEFFRFEEIVEEGDRRKVYTDHAKIELTVLNTGPDALNQYPIDEEITIGLEAFKGKKKRNRRYIKLKGEERRITKEELKNFGDWKDPLIFIDDEQTGIWPKKSPKERYNAVSRFIGIEDYKNKVKNARHDLDEASKKLEDANKKLRELHLKFQNTEKSYKRYQKKQEFKKKLSELKLAQLKANIHHTFTIFNDTQERFFTIYENNEKISEEIERLGNEIKSNTQKVKSIEGKYDTQKVEKEKLVKHLDDLKYTIRQFRNNYEIVISFLKRKNILISAISDYTKFENQKTHEQEDLEELRIELIKLQNESKICGKKLKDLECKKYDVKPYITNIQNKLKEENIKSELLFETLEFKKGTEQWQDYVENILVQNRLGIVVKEEDGRKAEQINREKNTKAIILSPRKKYILKGKQGLRNWSSLMEVSPEILSPETIENLMDLMMHGIYFANSIEEKEDFLAQAPYSRVFCLDGFTYNIYSQRKFNFNDITYMIGKEAPEKEKNRIRLQLDKINKELSKLNLEISNKEQNIGLINKKIEYLELKSKEEEIVELEKQKEKANNKLEDLISLLAFPQKSIERLNEDIERTKKNIEERKKTIEENKIELAQLTIELNNLTENFKNQFERIIILENVDFEEGAIRFIEKNRIDNNYSYRGINKEALKILELIQKPTHDLEYFDKEILKTESALEQYQDVDSSIVNVYEDAKQRIQTLNDLNKQFEVEKNECQNKFLVTVNNLRDKLLKWQDVVSRRYKSIMRALNLDGELEFNETEIEGDYQLNINVSNNIGGSLDLIEYSNFSKGERLRASIAFEMAILAESPSTFSVWDEFDQNIAEDHKELLALALETHLPNKKIICISPYTPTPGYIRIFPNIIHIYRNQEKESQISLIKFDEKVKSIGDLTDAIKQN